ncbi:MAG: glutamate racemase [Paludibacteraceae bacterium]
MKIGVFDSGYGGLTILEQIRKQLPEYDYLYLGDNARAPYGTHSFEVIHQYAWQAVQYLFRADCSLVILACNTASAKALRTIQQQDLPQWLRLHAAGDAGVQPAPNSPSPARNVLGVIRPTAEEVVRRTRNGHIGVLGTPGTVNSGSYVIELQKQRPDLRIVQQACPMWVPLIENGEHLQQGADYFVDKYLRLLFAQDPQIDTLVLGCTHYPLLLPKIREHLPAVAAHEVDVVAQGGIVALSLKDYLRRHTDIAATLSQAGTCTYLTTEQADKFSSSASLFLRTPVKSQHVVL